MQSHAGHRSRDSQDTTGWIRYCHDHVTLEVSCVFDLQERDGPPCLAVMEAFKQLNVEVKHAFCNSDCEVYPNLCSG